MPFLLPPCCENGYRLDRVMNMMKYSSKMMTFHLYLAGMARELLLKNEKVNTLISREKSKLKENKRDQMETMAD